MDAEDILDLLADPRFVSLTSVGGGWSLRHKIDETEGELRHGTLDRLLEIFAEVLCGEDEPN